MPLLTTVKASARGEESHCKHRHRTRALSVAVLACAGLAVALATMPVEAGTAGQSCIKEQVGGNPPCTANDVRLGALEVISGPDSCILGEQITVTMKATIESGPDRYDVGIWINESGGSAKSDPDGTCYRDYLPPPLEATTCVQDEGPYFNGEVSETGDTCGDVYAQNTDPCGNADIRPCTGGGGNCLFSFRTFTVTFACADSNGDGIADVGTCTSWDNQVDDNCTSELGTDPGTGSKCSCSPDEAGIPVGNITICGNGIVDGVEECDDGASNSDTIPDACRTDCTNPVCGDGVQDTTEQCDDGNVTNGDGCSAACENECTVTGDDTDCDGVDDDCDGTPDDGYLPTPTSCGVGECASTGTLECINGTEVNSCTPGTPGTGDACDGLDNDCDGSTDEDFASDPTTCGAGECAAAGNTFCDGTNGVQDDCDVNSTNGTFCGDDGTECTNQDICTAGSCTDNGFPGAGTPCGDSSDTVCDDPDTCDGAGSCQDNNEPTTTSCSDGNECTSTSTNAGDDDFCDGAGSCDIHNVVAGGACGSSTDNGCNLPDTCDGAGTCDDNFEPSSTTCDDLLFCTSTSGEPGTTDNCNGEGNETGACVGTAVDCSSFEDICNDGVCNEATDACQAQPANEGGGCDDGMACTELDVCAGGTCMGTAIPGCEKCTDASQCDDGNPCTDNTCSAGICVYIDNTLPCEDGNPCTVRLLRQSRRLQIVNRSKRLIVEPPKGGSSAYLNICS